MPMYLGGEGSFSDRLSVLDPLEDDDRARFRVDRGGPRARVVLGLLVVNRRGLRDAHAEGQLVAVELVDAEAVAFARAVDVDVSRRSGGVEPEGHGQTARGTG